MSRIKNLREEALALHKDNVGKIDIRIKVPARDNDDLTLAYSPGVAEPCKEINKDPAMLDVYTNHSNFVCVVSNGTAVLGLGDIARVPPCRSWKANLCCSNGLATWTLPAVRGHQGYRQDCRAGGACGPHVRRREP